MLCVVTAQTQNRQTVLFCYYQGLISDEILAVSIWSSMKNSSRTFFHICEVVVLNFFLSHICCWKCIWKCCAVHIALETHINFPSFVHYSGLSLSTISELKKIPFKIVTHHILWALCVSTRQKSFSVILTDNQCVIIDGSFTWLETVKLQIEFQRLGHLSLYSGLWFYCQDTLLETMLNEKW